MSDLCGWLIKGDSLRPCACKVGHKSKTHRDKDQLARERAKAAPLIAQWQVDHRDLINQRRSTTYRASARAWEREYSKRPGPAEYRRTKERRRRARKAQVPTERWTRATVLSKYGDCCWLCHGQLGNTWDVDHVIPIARGGWDTMINLRPACRFCNRSKRDKLRGDPLLIQILLREMDIK